ncbi:MAG TPA: hypothetical protein VN130_05745 [Xanthobacteraceae bacterium]|nr:hypothetical protein [Xanthobacteraceae bacterium]
MTTLSEPFGLEERNGQVDEHSSEYDRSQHVIEGHLHPLKMITDIGVAEGHHEKSEADREHDDVQHFSRSRCMVANRRRMTAARFEPFNSYPRQA